MNFELTDFAVLSRLLDELVTHAVLCGPPIELRCGVELYPNLRDYPYVKG